MEDFTEDAIFNWNQRRCKSKGGNVRLRSVGDGAVTGKDHCEIYVKVLR
jgi:hypothetical protein